MTDKSTQELYNYKNIACKFFDYLNNNNYYNDDEIIYNVDDIIFEQNNMKLLYDNFHNNNLIDIYNIYDSFVEFVNYDYINSLNYYENNSETFYKKLLNEYIKNVFDKVFQIKDEKNYILYSVKINWVEALEYYLQSNYKYTIQSYNEAFINNNLNMVKLLWQSNNEMLYTDEKIMDLACKNASLEIIEYLWSVDKKGKNRCNHISSKSYVNALSRKDNKIINVLDWLNNNTFLNTSDLLKRIYFNEYDTDVKLWLKKYT